MWVRNLAVFINIFLFLVLKINASKNIDSNEVSLQNVVQQILKISPPDVPVGDFRGDEQPPKHMLELYRRFTTGRRATGETVRSITPNIDSISVPHQPHDPRGLTFTITRLDPTEDVRLAQLVLRRRRISRHPHPLHRKLLPPPFRVRVFEVSGRKEGKIRSVPLASVPVPQVTRGGWHSLDITSAVRELLLSSPSTDEHILGVRFEAPRSKILSLSHFLDQKDNNSAFLMLFTEESQENEVKNKEKRPRITQEHIEIIEKHVKRKEDNNEDDKLNEKHVKQRHYLHHKGKKNREEKINPRRHKNKNPDYLTEDNNNNNNEVQVSDDLEEDTDIKELININQVKKLKRHKKLFDDFNMKYDDERESDLRLKIKSNLIDEILENSDTKRVIRSTSPVDPITEDVSQKDPSKFHRRRSIYDNELPYEKLHIKDHSKALVTEKPDVEETPDVVTEDTIDDKNLIPYPPGTKRKRKYRRGRKRNHKGRVSKIPDDWNKDEWSRSTNSSSNTTCSRRHLVVNFKDLGWTDWVIAPKLFNAHYCAGSCNFPIPEHKRRRVHRRNKCNVPATNHAIVQSLIHDHGIHNVPAPCCVPHSMSPLTILYLQDNNHVILRNYRSMTVETCGCR